MKMNEASRFMRDISRAPEENLSRAILSGKFKGHLNEKERLFLRGYLADNEEILQKALEALAEAEGAAQRYLGAQPARNRSENKLPWNLQDRLKKARALPKQLEKERSILEKAIKESLMAEQIQLQELGEKKSVALSVKAKKFVESISEKPDTVDLVIELANSLNGKSLEATFMPILKAKSTLEDLATERRYISEQHNITVDELPSAPDLDYVPDLQAAIEKLLGKRIEISRSRIWRRIWAQQRSDDRDRAAKRLGII